MSAVANFSSPVSTREQVLSGEKYGILYSNSAKLTWERRGLLGCEIPTSGVPFREKKTVSAVSRSTNTEVWPQGGGRGGVVYLQTIDPLGSRSSEYGRFSLRPCQLCVTDVHTGILSQEEVTTPTMKKSTFTAFRWFHTKATRKGKNSSNAARGRGTSQPSAQAEN